MTPEEQRTAEGFLYTDQYQLTMAQLYFRMGLHERPALFDHFFRSYPDYGKHEAGYCINAGLEWLVDWMQRTRIMDSDIEHLRGQRTRTGRPVFADDFLVWLRENGNFEHITLHAIPEGRVVHPNVPLTTVEGPLALAQILETSLLNHLNYPTLIATKAARIFLAGRQRLMLEFGLRRAQFTAGNAGARAALIGGAQFTSNVGISHMLGLDPKGTHAHSMVQVFLAMGESELDAFQAYADVYPDECLLLVDTIDTLNSGVPNAIRVFEGLRRKGHEPVGIRLDSGDLAYLSIQAAKMLDAAGFSETSIVLSNQLDELNLWQILSEIGSTAPQYGVDPDSVANRLVYGVGTSLITSAGDAALDGVYKLVAVKTDSVWTPALKISETPIKTPNPGKKGVWRVYDQQGKAIADVLGLEDEDLMQSESLMLRHPSDHTRYRSLPHDAISRIEALQVPILQEGRLVYDLPSLDALRDQRTADIERLYPGVRRLINPHHYHVSLTEPLWALKQDLIAQAR